MLKYIYSFFINILIFANTACGESLRELDGNITGPVNLPFNETSYICHWTLEPPEYLMNSVNDTGVTLTLEVTGDLGATNSSSFSIPCEFPQYIELSGNVIIKRKCRKS